MKSPKIKTVKPINNHTLLVEFDNQQKKHYNILPLFAHELFLPLKNPVLFKSVQVEQGGYAVVWNDSIDISEHELWCNGQEITSEMHYNA